MSRWGLAVIGVLLVLAACDQRWDDLRRTGQSPPDADGSTTGLVFSLGNPDPEYAVSILLPATAYYWALNDETVIEAVGTIEDTGTVTLILTTDGATTGTFAIDGGTNASFSLEIDNGDRSLSLPPDLTSGSATIWTYGPVGGMLEGSFEAEGSGATVFANFNVMRGSNQ